jgi:hypothetical protein
MTRVMRVADCNRRLRFSLTLEHVLSSMLTPISSYANTVPMNTL